MFRKAVQFCTFLENKAGRFSEFCEILYERGIDILAFNLHADTEIGIVRMVVDNAKVAEDLLKEMGVPFFKTEVLLIEVPNQKGMAAGIGHRLAQAGINIEYTYFTAGPGGLPSLMVFKVANIEDAISRLGNSSKIYN